MNISQYLIYIPYRITWSILHLFRRKKQIHFYCGHLVDYTVMKTIIDHFPDAYVVAKNRKVKNELNRFGIECKMYPTFPDILVMPRHAARKYPERRMKKIGLRHGAFNFKGNVGKSRFHAFDIYFVSSRTEYEMAKREGIKNTYPVGFPKLDPAFNGAMNQDKLDLYRLKLDLNPEKPIIIFTTTWDKSGMSAIDQWANRLSELTHLYNVLVTVHPWTDQKYKCILENIGDIHFLKDNYVLPYLMLADVMVADASSIIGDFCALDKPIITFKVPYKRTVPQLVRDMIDQISIRIENFDDLPKAIQESLNNPKYFSPIRLKFNRIMFDTLDGKAGERAANKIKELFIKE